MEEIAIIDRCGSPGLARTRITVFDLIPLLRKGYTPEEITEILPITTAEVHALSRYIDDHRDEIMAMNARIEERIARGNPPWVEELRRESHKKLLALKEELRKKRESEKSHEGHCGRHQHPEAGPHPEPHPVR